MILVCCPSSFLLPPTSATEREGVKERWTSKRGRWGWFRVGCVDGRVASCKERTGRSWGRCWLECKFKERYKGGGVWARSPEREALEGEGDAKLEEHKLHSTTTGWTRTLVGASLNCTRRGGGGASALLCVLGTKGGAAQAWLQCGWHQSSKQFFLFFANKL